MQQDPIHRLSSQCANCKLCGVFLGVAILLAGALGRLGAVNLLWAAAPLLLLGLTDAGYAAEQRRCAKLAQDQNGNESIPGPPEAAAASILGTVSAILLPSIWPFYLGLLGTVTAGALLMPIKEPPAPVMPAMAASPINNLPGQPYRPMTPLPMLPRNVPQRPHVGTPFPGEVPFHGQSPFPMKPATTPVIQRNTSPAIQKPVAPITDNPSPSLVPTPVPAPTPVSTRPSTPAIPNPAGKKP